MLPPLVILLFITQVYACKILFMLSEKTKYAENGTSHGKRALVRSCNSVWNMGISEDDKTSLSSLWSLRSKNPVESGNVENINEDDSSEAKEHTAEVDKEEQAEMIASDD